MRGIVVTLLVAGLATPCLATQVVANPRVVEHDRTLPYSPRDLVDALGAYSFRHLPSGYEQSAHFDSILAESQSPEHGLQDENVQLYLERASSIEPLLRSLEAWSGAVLPSPRNGIRIRGPQSVVDSLLSEDKRRAAAWVDKAKLARAAWVPGQRRHEVTSVDARFASERVEISIYDGSAEVDAQYFFTKMRGRPLPMSFPFPDDSSLGRPSLNSASFQCDDGGFQRLRVDGSDNAWLFKIPAECGSAEVRLSYHQNYARRMTYVLWTAATWPHKVGRAEFVVQLESPEITNARISLPLVRDSTNARVFRGTFTNFAPDHDLTIDVEPAPQTTVESSSPRMDVASVLANAFESRPVGGFITPSGELRGVVRLQSGTPVAFANVIVGPEKMGVTADVNGVFTLLLPEGVHTVDVTSVSAQVTHGFVPTYRNQATTLEIILIER